MIRKAHRRSNATPQSSHREEVLHLLKEYPNLADNEVWWTFADVMRAFNISRSTLSRWIKQRFLPYFKMGRTYFFPKELLYRLFYLKMANNMASGK